MLHDITIRNQAVYTKLGFSRLPLATHFAMHCHECRLEKTMAKTFEQLVPNAPKGRFDGISRPYTPAEVEKLRGSGEHMGFVALNVELEEDVTVGGGRWDDVIEAAEGDFFFLEVGGVWGGGEVGVEHGKDGAGERVGRDVDLDFAGCGAEGHAVGYGPEGVCCSGLKEAGVCGGGGLEGDDLAFVAGCAALMDELTGVGAYVEHEVDRELGEEEVVAEFL